MISINKKQALKMRGELLALSVVLVHGAYGFELLHQSGVIYALRRIDTPIRLVYATLDSTRTVADYLKFDRYAIRLQESKE